MIQGVREVFEISDLERDHKREAAAGKSEAQQEGKMVLIGRGLDQEAFARSLGWCLEGGGEGGEV